MINLLFSNRKMNNCWHEIKFNPEKVTAPVRLEFLENIKVAYHKAGEPRNFAVYTDITRDGFWLYYLTPACSEFSAHLIKIYKGEVCSEPILSKEFGAMVFGDHHDAIKIEYHQETAWRLQ